MFKFGDEIICIDNKYATDILTINKKYIVKKNINGETIVFIVNDGGYINCFNCDRFILDVKYQRKQKLNKICLKSEIE